MSSELLLNSNSHTNNHNINPDQIHGAMRVLLLVLFLASLATASLWLSPDSLEDSIRKLENGENIVLLSVGSKQHNERTITEVTEAFSVYDHLCIDLCTTKNTIDDIRAYWSVEHVKGPVLVVVHSLHQLANSERTQLDFVYRITDSSSELTNIIILLTVEIGGQRGKADGHQSLPAAPPSVTHRGQVDSMKAALANALNEESVYFNGHAFIGRVSQASFDQHYEHVRLGGTGCVALEQNYHSSKSVCSTIRFPSYSSTNSNIHKIISSTINLKVVFGIGMGAAIIALFVHLNRKGSEQKDDEFKESQSRRSIPALVVEPVSRESYTYGIENSDYVATGQLGNNREIPRSPRCMLEENFTSTLEKSNSGERKSPKFSTSSRVRPNSESQRAKRELRKMNSPEPQDARKIEDTAINGHSGTGHEYSTRSKSDRRSCNF